MRSIRTQLVTSLVIGVLALSALVAVGIYEYMEEALERSFDAALAAKAETIAGAVHIEDDGQPHLLMTEAEASASTKHEGPFFFQLFRADGRVIAQFLPDEKTTDLLAKIKPARRFTDLELPDGNDARLTRVLFTPKPDEDEFDHPTTRKVTDQLTLLVAHDRRSIDGPLRVLMSGLIGGAGVLSVGIFLIVSWGVRRGLEPLRELGKLSDKIAPESLGVRFPGENAVPAELLPVVMKLNDLLDRLQAGFARERRISAAVAHELRTPLAELQSLCEVTLRFPQDDGSSKKTISEALAISSEMNTIVENLMLLARCQEGVEKPRVENIRLAEFTGELVRADADLKFEIDEQQQVLVDPRVLRVILRNVISNAVEYKTAESKWQIAAERSGDAVKLRIGNATSGLSVDDLTLLREPFWRKDGARTGGNHAGLGLAIVDAYCRIAGIEMTTTLVDGWFENVLLLPI